ncbi:MAG TPA: fumarylacetoacetate hydrolase family protein, partial [Rhodanobacteraceae bacterium]|nr:fumarylacetoacetate hydrolase family protein [Rhodanobacteraceae bacterium]
MRQARVAYAGALHVAYPDAGGLRLEDGRVCAEDAVVWLPPVEVGTLFALGLNYAEHARELSFSKQQRPLVFMKGPNALLGHRGFTRRPDGVANMHYECELAVVIGRPARAVAARDAMAYVAGFTIANDYTVRDYLENYYRPNLRAKNRDGATVLGPWFVDAADVSDYDALEITTTVNGRETQRGNTRDMVTKVPELVAYLSRSMTLAPGDVILTGTPKGVVNVNAGDVVTCEIGGLGRLV